MRLWGISLTLLTITGCSVLDTVADVVVGEATGYEVYVVIYKDGTPYKTFKCDYDQDSKMPINCKDVEGVPK